MKKPPLQAASLPNPVLCSNSYAGMRAGALPLPTAAQERREKKLARKRFALEMSLMMILVSFLGWCMETVYCSLLAGKFTDRGFLTLPFCTIYGTSVVGIYLLLGTPVKGRLVDLLRRTRMPKWLSVTLSVLVYFVAAALIPTLVELATGWFFDEFFGVRLWSYTGYKYNFKGYICLEFTLLWGVLITAAMATAWHLLHWLIHKIPSRPLFWLSAVFRVVLTMDFLFNFGYLLKTGKHFSLEKLALGLGKLFSLRKPLGGCF